MPEFTVTVFYTTSREVVVRARGYKHAAKKAIDVAGKEEVNTQELDGAEVTDEARTEVRYFEYLAGELQEDDGTIFPEGV